MSTPVDVEITTSGGARVVVPGTLEGNRVRVVLSGVDLGNSARVAATSAVGRAAEQGANKLIDAALSKLFRSGG